MNKGDGLYNIKLFENLNGFEICRVEEFAIEETFSKGKYIFRQDEQPNYFYIIKKGFIKLIRSTSIGISTIVGIASKGEQLNASFILENKPYSYSAKAISEGNLIKIPQKLFLLLLKEFPTINKNLMIDISEKLRTVIENLSSFISLKVEGRLCKVLANLAKKYGINGDCRGIILELPLTRQDIADLTGTTLETTIRSLKKMKEFGLIEWEGKRFFIPDIHSLESAGIKN